MELYHLVAISKFPTWTLTQTATVFEVSLALVSENLKLAEASHDNPTLLNYSTRAEALNRLRRLG